MYDIIKSIHIISVISWMAGLLYLPRIFVYHAQNMDNPSIKAVFCVMERRLFKFIMMPAMILTLITGGYMTSKIIFFPLYAWFVAKISFVGFLLIFHFFCFYFIKEFSRGNCKFNPSFFRLMNEIPTFLMIVIVVLVVTKSF